MSEKIGYNDGLTGFVGFMRKIPGVRYRDQDKRPTGLSEWYWLEKMERTLRILKDDHDSAIVAPEPPPPPPPPPPSGTVAPRTYNTVANGPDARFCVEGLPRNSRGRRYDIYSEYDDNGLDLGGRTTLHVDGLKPANEMDGRGPCDPYFNFPPWPAASYEK